MSDLATQLGARTYRVYKELISFVEVHGFVPSYQELGERVGCAPSTIMRHLQKLERAELIERRRGRTRSIVIRVADVGQ